tara:strand:- start:433 stop:1044 length:612 start_codon:yes stop_codon:yes gene_type:complete
MKTLVILFTLLFTTLAHAGSTQSNVSGSNTAIEGGYESSTTYQSGSSSNSTTTNSTTSNIRSAPPSAYAPGVNSSGIDVCSTGASMGIQTFGLGVSGGKSFRDENCERIKLSRQLDSMGMKVAAVALLCQDERVFFAMEQAGTPCPFQGKIGKDATKLWKKYDKLRPDYEIYIKNLKIVQNKNKKEEREKNKIKIEKLNSKKK